MFDWVLKTPIGWLDRKNGRPFSPVSCEIRVFMEETLIENKQVVCSLTFLLNNIFLRILLLKNQM